MKNWTITREVYLLANQLEEQFKIPKGEALQIALKAEQNEILKRAFVVTREDKVPTALEAITIELKEKLKN